MKTKSPREPRLQNVAAQTEKSRAIVDAILKDEPKIEIDYAAIEERLISRTNTKERYITVTQGIGGWFAVLVWMNPDMGGFYEPYETGVGRYATRAEAETEARMWAHSEGLEFRQ